MFEGQFVLGVVGVPTPGGGKAESIPESPPPDFRRFSSSPVLIQSQPNRLAVFPRSRLAASLVARLMRSGKLVIEPLASASRTASTFNLGGRFVPTRSASVPLVLWRTSLAVAGSSAPPFSSPPKIWSTRESLGLMGDLGPERPVGFEGESFAYRYSLFRGSPMFIDNSSEEGDESSNKTLESRNRDRDAFGVMICGGDCKDGMTDLIVIISMIFIFKPNVIKFWASLQLDCQEPDRFFQSNNLLS